MAKRSANGFHFNHNKSWSGHGYNSIASTAHKEASCMKEMRCCETCFRSYHFYSSGMSPWNPDESMATGMSVSLGTNSLKTSVLYTHMHISIHTFIAIVVVILTILFFIAAGGSNRSVKQALGLGLGLEELEWDFEHRQSMLSLKEDIERASTVGHPQIHILFR